MILAAGVLCWRRSATETEILLVHRPKHNDWSFPKGKVEPGEPLPATAVRELREETGLELPLGPYVNRVEYEVHKNRPKRVSYWSAEVPSAAWEAAEVQFTPSKEIAERRWIPCRQALNQLTYSRDRALLAHFLTQPQLQVPLQTATAIVLRHAKAISRSDWNGTDADRPLTGRGRSQSEALPHWLAPWGPSQIVSSPWLRCQQTVLPRAQELHIEPEILDSLSEDGYAADPLRTERESAALLEPGRTVLICSHRPVLPAVLSTIGMLTGNDARAQVLPYGSMPVAGFAVLQCGLTATGTWTLLSHELHEVEPES